MAQQMHPCQLSTQRAVTILVLIFPPSQWHAQETHSSCIGGVTLAPKGRGGAKEVAPCPAPWTKAGNWMHWQLGGRGANAKGEGLRESSFSCDGYPLRASMLHSHHACQWVHPTLPSTTVEEAKEGKGWSIHTTAETKQIDASGNVGRRMKKLCEWPSN